MTTEARERLLEGVATFDAPGPITADITPRNWYINPWTGWPWPSVIARRGDSDELAEARRRAARRIRVLRILMASDRIETHPLYSLLPSERIRASLAEIRSLREIFGRPAPRPGRPDLAGAGDGAASRDEGALTEAPVRPHAGASRAPDSAVSFPRRHDRDPAPGSP